jgi:hypothetical protein
MKLLVKRFVGPATEALRFDRVRKAELS